MPNSCPLLGVPIATSFLKRLKWLFLFCEVKSSKLGLKKSRLVPALNQNTKFYFSLKLGGHKKNKQTNKMSLCVAANA